MLMVCLALFTQCKDSSVTVTLDVENNKQIRAELFFGDERKELAFDENGNASITLEGMKSPLHAVLVYKRMDKTLYLEPGKNLTISFPSNNFFKGTSYEGESADVNYFIDTLKLAHPKFTDIELNEVDYVAELKRCIAENSMNIEKQDFDKKFKKVEKERLKYYLLSWAAKYPRYYKPQNQDENFQPALNFYYDELQSFIKEDDELLKIKEYKEFIVNAVSALSLKDYHGLDKYWFTLEVITTKLNWCVAHIKNPELLGFLIHTYVMNYVGQHGIETAGPMIALHKEKVNSPKLKSDFQNLYTEWANLAKGKQAPTFTCQDTSGKVVKLEDFRGKYVLIDLWATWCGPCCKEHPYFKQLEEEYHGKEIYFVSISTDRDKKLWMKKLKKDKLSGIQLNMREIHHFMKVYKIAGIPRFILIDKEGKIVNVKMPYPSDPKTKEILNSLEGI